MAGLKRWGVRYMVDKLVDAISPVAADVAAGKLQIREAAKMAMEAYSRPRT